MKPTHTLYKTTDKLLKGKQLMNIGNDDTQGRQKRHYFLTACVLKKEPPLSFPVVYDPPFDTGSDVFLINPMIYGYKKEMEENENEEEKEKEKEEKELKDEKSDKFEAVDEKMITIFSSPRKLFSIVKQFNGLNGHLVQLRLFTTTARMKSFDNCLPPPEPPKPKKCIIPQVKPPCTIPTHSKWEGCDKICMPCCCPAIETCREINPPRLNTCKKIEYRLPSFGECKKSRLPRPCPKECCYIKYICPYETVGSSIRPLISVKVRQAWILGRKTTFDHLKHFSTSAASRKEEDCKKSGVLPCLRASEILGTQKKKTSGLKACEKICMPCCAPARDPPDCFYPYVKPECKKLRPPRPAYSECKKDMMKSPKPCECLIPRPPPCRRSEDSKGCAK